MMLIKKISFILLVSLMVTSFGTPQLVFSQGFLVKPMILDLKTQPARQVDAVLEIQNRVIGRESIVDIEVVPISQGTDGTLIIEPENLAKNQAIPSCLEWLKLSSDSVIISPLKSEKIIVSVTPPPKVQGSYAAGLIIQSRATQVKSGLGIIIRFLVPVFLEVQGVSARKNVSCLDAGIEYLPAPKNADAADRVFIQLENKGDAMAIVGGNLTILGQEGERWRQITQLKVEDRRILRGANFSRHFNSPRRLPPGKYRIDAYLTVDGRTLPGFKKELDYVGDPNIKSIASDVSLVVDPPILEIGAVPGSMRSAFLTVQNPAEYPIQIISKIIQPKVLTGVAIGEVLGDHFTCHPWAQVRPDSFSLPAGQKRKIAVQVTLPREDSLKASYYGTIAIKAIYPDMQPAGATETLVVVHNQKKNAAPKLQPMGISIYEDARGVYSVKAEFGNSGDIFLTPICKGSVTDQSGLKLITRFDFSGEPASVLPLGVVNFNGSIDFTKIPAGTYLIDAVAEFNGQKTEQKVGIRVRKTKSDCQVTVIN